MYGLANLIKPELPDNFMQHVWGETALHLPGQIDRFLELFSSRDLEWFLDHADLAYPNTGLVLDKTNISTSTISKSDIHHWRKQGATLILPGIHRWHPQVSKYALELHRQLSPYLQMTSVQVNSYLSGPHRQGFDVHYDTHDVFVIQLQGAKTWSIFPPSMKWMGPRDQSLIAPETPYLNCVVSEGDVLYIPKGHWHAAVAQNSESLHLTVGIHARTGIDFLQWVVERLTHLPIDGAKWRQHLPATGKLTNHLAHLAQQTGLALDNPSLISAFIEHCQATTDDKMDHLHRVAASRAETPHIDPIVDQEAQPTHDDIRQAEKQAIAHALLSKGLEPAFIAEVTGLSRQDLLASADASRPPLGRPPQEPRL